MYERTTGNGMPSVEIDFWSLTSRKNLGHSSPRHTSFLGIRASRIRVQHTLPKCRWSLYSDFCGGRYHLCYKFQSVLNERFKSKLAKTVDIEILRRSGAFRWLKNSQKMKRNFHIANPVHSRTTFKIWNG